MGICMSSDYHKLYSRVREKILCRAIMLSFGKVNSTVASWRCTLCRRPGGSLQECVNVKLFHWQEVW